jgi:hypothetical protein
VHFLAAELSRWDALALPGPGKGDGLPPDALVIGVFADERPLRGAAGLCDWRLAGRLSRLLKADRLGGRADEVLMMPPANARLPFSRLLMFGLGGQAGYGEARYRADVIRLRVVAERAGLRSYAVQPPGRSAGLIAARRALELWMDVSQGDGYEHDVTIIESPAGQKEMAEAMRARR